MNAGRIKPPRALLGSIDEVKRFLDDHQQRHGRVDDLTCTCGWSVGPGLGVTWALHNGCAWAWDLADNLESSVVGESWPEALNATTEAMDRAHTEFDVGVKILAAMGQHDPAAAVGWLGNIWTGHKRVEDLPGYDEAVEMREARWRQPPAD